MTLSDKIWNPKMYKDRFLIELEDVKQFIKDLKKEVKRWWISRPRSVESSALIDILVRIDKLAGEELV